MTYNELLKQESWYEKCVEILHRDKYRCQKSGALGYYLTVILITLYNNNIY